jgi:hypothetical protein
LARLPRLGLAPWTTPKGIGTGLENPTSVTDPTGSSISRREAIQKAGASIAALAAGRYLLAGSIARATSLPDTAWVLQVAVVRPRTRAQAAALIAFDDTHKRSEDAVELLLWPGDAERLEELGIDYTITIPDLAAHDLVMKRKAPKALPASAQKMPGGDRTDYRRLADYESELHELADKHKGMARLIEMPNRSIEGRTVYGIEIGVDVDQEDGRPMSYIDGIHHAREWPAAEYPMIFAHYLLENYGRNKKVTSVLKSSRVAIVPVMNVDGFHYSREFPIDDPGGNSGIVLGGQGAYWRKNRRQQPTTSTPPNGETNPIAYGVDPNRNYPFFWGATNRGLNGLAGDAGGPVPLLAATSPNPFDQTYYGTDALSEPETLNVTQYLLSRNATGLISNHTVAALVLRPWGHTTDDPIDVALLKKLGDEMGLILGFTSQIGLGLYVTTGTTSDWHYASTAGLSYTVEHGGTDFHDPYTTPRAPGVFWPKVMDAFMVLVRAAAEPRNHCVIKGRVVDAKGKSLPGAKLVLHKEFDSPYWPVGVDGIGPALSTRKSTHEVLDISMKADGDGRFEWHVNPSTRPLIAAEGKKETYALKITSSGHKPGKRKIFLKRGDVLDLGDVTLA